MSNSTVAGGDGHAPDPAPPPDAFADALRRATGAPVETRETHVSTVFLTGDRAYKLKKPVRLAFVDQSTPERRRALCEEEIRVNRVLAPDVALGVRAVVARDGTYALADADAAGAVDWVVEMRRFDERRTMRALLDRGELTEAQVDAVGARLARFHREAETIRLDLPAAVEAQCERNFAELAPLVRGARGGDGLATAERLAEAFVAARADELAWRARHGLVVDGHGDLRAEHVLLAEDAVTVVDRLEFDAELRHVDVADDLAFLVMDLESRGGRWAADALVAAYRAAGGDPGDDALVAFYAAYRAQVRAKVELLRVNVTRARELLDLGDRFGWRARGPLVLLVTGPPASGKTTLARRLGDASGFPVLSSDDVRREVATGADRYADDRRAAVYGELARRADRALAAAGGVIVDATFGEAPLQQRFLDVLGDASRHVRVIECRTPPAVRLERAAARAAAGGSTSEADAAVAAKLAARYTPMPDPDRFVAGPDAAPVAVAAWLDAAL